MTHLRRLMAAITLALLLTSGVSVGLSAQAAPPAPPVTGVLALLSIKPDAPRADIMKVLPSEVHDTVSLYLEGKISQWYGRGDGRGVVFILNCSTVEEGRAITDSLPLAKADLATFDYVALTPLTPLRMLMTDAQ